VRIAVRLAGSRLLVNLPSFAMSNAATAAATAWSLARTWLSNSATCRRRSAMTSCAIIASLALTSPTPPEALIIDRLPAGESLCPGDPDEDAVRHAWLRRSSSNSHTVSCSSAHRASKTSYSDFGTTSRPRNSPT
jgi:hypothetical protein